MKIHIFIKALSLALLCHTNYNLFAKNPAPWVPAQCYTKTEEQNTKYNPCYVCHTESILSNMVDDRELQLSYDFSEDLLKNHWSGFFNSKETHLSDEEITQYVRENNYPKLASTLKNLHHEWDINTNGKWDGYIPDAFFNFDKEGFDLNKNKDNQVYSGWRAFSYYPVPGTFWPNNGSFDDVLIRLPALFQNNKDGMYDKNTYQLNLQIVQSLLTAKNTSIPPTDETLYGVDLDMDGSLSIAHQITFNWPGKMSYIGEAQQALQNKSIYLAAGLYPVGTEFLHSVRYLDINNGKVRMAKRMKELRYMKKIRWLNYMQLESISLHETKEKHDFPDRLTWPKGNMESGMFNGRGWLIQGFIENSEGMLRPQNNEETAFCIGCHGGIGVTVDSIFSFHKPVYNSNKNWRHWSQIYNKPFPDRVLNDGETEITRYLRLNPGGDEFRNKTPGQKNILDTEDIRSFLLPSPIQAARLNRQYKAIVEQQDFIHGRSSTLTPVKNILDHIEPDQKTGIKKSSSAF